MSEQLISKLKNIVKGNQKALLEAVQKALSSKIANSVMSFEKADGRNEARAYHVMSGEEMAVQFPQWKGLRSIGVAMGYRQTKDGKTSLEYRYYISSLPLSKAQFANAVRSHWAIENSLHWVLDASMKEDNCQIYRGNSAEILSVVRHLALNMLRCETSRKISIPRKQKRAYGSPEYLEVVVMAGMSQHEKN